MAVDVLQSCSEQSLKAKEPLLGTATGDIDVWLLVEYPGGWEADIATNALAPSAREWLDGALARIPRSRALFIRRDRPARNLTFYIVTVQPQRSVSRFAVSDHADLARIDVEAVVAGGPQAAEAQGGERGRALYVVCTHGKRDACCARKGTAFHRALEGADPDGEVWQSSHQGGHRFAATMLYLPYGIHYGRLEPDDAEHMAQAHARGRLHDLARYRGLTTVSGATQAAEAWLRQALDERRIDAFELLGQTSDGAGRHTVEFGARTGEQHRVVVVEKPGAAPRLASCDAKVPTPFSSYGVVRHEARG